MTKYSIILFLFLVFSANAQRFKEVPIQVVAPQTMVVNSLGGKFLGKKNQVLLTFQLPENTIRWFYIFSASRDKATIDRDKTRT